MKTLKIIILLMIISVNCSFSKETDKVKVVNNASQKKVDVLVDGKLFTSYIYTDTLPVLKKPVLYPVISAEGITVTRGYPLNPKAGERTDHPHHIGVWFNYGNVNGFDFWNNSNAIAKEKSDQMGTIVNEEITKATSGKGKGKLSVKTKWITGKNEAVISEKTEFSFYAKPKIRVIERKTTLTALGGDVLFKDDKEGLFGMRVARELELPSNQPVELLDSHGNKTQVPVLDNTGITGNYLSSTGVTGAAVWGKRADWVALSGKIKNNDVTIVIFDNPGNTGYPSYWHARDYGLFAVNPLGQSIFTNGKETLNFKLEAGKSVTFKYGILIYDGKAEKSLIEKEYGSFVKRNSVK